MDKYQNVKLAIKRVKEISFGVNEELFKADRPEIKINFEHRNDIIPETNLFNFAFRAYYFYEDAPNEILVDLHITNLFEVVDFSEYIDKEGRILFADNIWASITAMAISHTRALMAKNLAGTPYDRFILPIMNAVQIAKAFFPPIVETKSE